MRNVFQTRGLRVTTILGTGLIALMPTTAFAQDKPLAGVTLTLASQNDQFGAVLAKMAPMFKEATGADLKVEIMDYGTLLTKTTADFIGDTKGYDLVTMDIVWAGAYAENGYSVDLTDWVARDAAELELDDIYPVALTSLGQYDGKYVAFPFAAYANVLAYRKDLFEAAGLALPATTEELVEAAKKLTDPSKNQYGFVANGQKGAAVAQDWMQYNTQLVARSWAKTASRRSTRPRTSIASQSTSSSSSRPPLRAPSSTIGAGVKRASARASPP